MESFLTDAVEKYLELVPGTKLRKVTTPFLEDLDPDFPEGHDKPPGTAQDDVTSTAKVIKEKLKKAMDEVPKGALAHIAASI